MDTPLIFSHYLQGALVVRTLCTGGCAKTKTHKEEGGGVLVQGELSGCLHYFVLCTVDTFLLYLSRLGVDFTTYLELLDFLFKYEKHISPYVGGKKAYGIFCSELQ